MRRRRRRFRNCWIAIRASPGGASARYASRGMVSGRGSHRPEEQPDPGVGANRQPASGAEGSRFRFGLFVWCGLPVGAQSGGADHADLQYRRDEPPSQRDQQPGRRGCPCRGDPRWCQLAQQPWTGGAQQYHVVGAAALQPGAQSSGAGLALSAQPLARQLGISQPGGHHGRLRDGVEPVRHQQRPGPLALRGRLGSSFARFIGGTNYVAEIEPTLASRNLRRSVLLKTPSRWPSAIGTASAEIADTSAKDRVMSQTRTDPEAFPPINVSGPGPAEEEGCEISVPLTVVMPPRFRSSSWPNGSISTGPPARRSLRLRRAIAR